MIKILIGIIKADKVNWVVTLEMSKRDLENIVESVDSMSEKQQRTLLALHQKIKIDRS